MRREGSLPGGEAAVGMTKSNETVGSFVSPAKNALAPGGESATREAAGGFAAVKGVDVAGSVGCFVGG